MAAEAARIPRVVLFHMPEYLPGPGRPAAGPAFLPREDLLGRLRDGLLTRLFYRLLASYLPAFNETRRTFGLASFETPQELLGLFHCADLRLIQTTEADAVVTHAGHGTVMRALAHGLPILCLPMGRDQDDNAARVVASRVGLRLSPSARPARIASAVRRLLVEPQFRENARRLRRIIDEDMVADRGVRELEVVGQNRILDPA